MDKVHYCSDLDYLAVAVLGGGPVSADPRLMVNHTTETVVTPRVIQHLYNVPK